MAGAQALFEKSPHEFQRWAIALIPDAQPWKSGKKGSDSGIDGIVYLRTGRSETHRGVISVKGGKNVGVAMVRDLGHVVEREKALIGLFITLTPPTSEMIKEAVKAGYVETDNGRYRKLQIFAVEDLMAGARAELPIVDNSAFRRAKREDVNSQSEMNV